MTILAFVLGAAVGSFLNVLILRLPKDKSPDGRSHCVNCGHDLAWYDLIPILSYIILLGKCRYCHKPISPRYIIIELITAILFTAAYIFFPVNNISSALVFFRAIFITSVLITVFTIDLEHFLILDKVIFPSSIILLGLNFLINPTTYGSRGLVAGLFVFIFFGLIYLISKGRWIGMGDVKYSWFLGFAAPLPLIIVTIFIAFMLGAIVGILLIITANKKMSSKIAFGTFLSFAALITLFYGQTLLDWYLFDLLSLPIPV